MTLYASMILTGVGLTTTIAANIGLFVWTKAGYFSDATFPEHWAGYNVPTFLGLLAFTMLVSTGVSLVYMGISAMFRVHRSPWTVGLYAALAVTFIVLGSLGMIWGQETMKCAGAFCLGTNKYIEIPGERPEAGLGFLAVVGTAAFISLIPMGCLMLLSIFPFSISSRSGAMQVRMGMVWPQGHSIIWTVVLLATLAGFAIVTFYIPNSWEHFVASRIAQHANTVAAHNATKCDIWWRNTTCPEIHGAVLLTKNWRWTSNLVLKVYPSNAIFFMYLLSLVLIVTVIRWHRSGRMFLKKTALTVPGRFSFTYGEILFSLATAAMLGCFLFYWVHDHNFGGNGSRRSSLAEVWARSLGQLAVALLSLLFFPASRLSVMHSMLGTSWEASIWVHRILGYGMLAATIGHIVGFYVVYYEKGSFPRDIFAIPPSDAASTSNFTIPLASITTWFSLIAFGVFAFYPIRRKFFELFYYLHIVAAYMLIPTVLWHAAAGWEYLLPGVTVWFVDRVIRMYRSAAVATVVAASTNGKVAELFFNHPTLSASPGQYVFINVPEISVIEWHPFTLSSSTDDEVFSLHIASMGEKTWTGRLVNYIAAEGASFTLAVDGPCGHAHDFNDYRKVILIAGGIGITPCISIYNSLTASQRVLGGPTAVSVALVWAVRDAALVSTVVPLLHESTDGKRSVNEFQSLDEELLGRTNPILFFFTSAQQGQCAKEIAMTKSQIAFHIRRPNVSVEIHALIGTDEPGDVLVFACGPEALVNSAHTAAMSIGAHFHRETFIL